MCLNRINLVFFLKLYTNKLFEKNIGDVYVKNVSPISLNK